jgi:hypothetical protein
MVHPNNFCHNLQSCLFPSGSPTKIHLSCDVSCNECRRINKARSYFHTRCSAGVYWILRSKPCCLNARVSMIEICRIFSDQSGRMVHYWRILCFNTCSPRTGPFARLHVTNRIERAAACKSDTWDMAGRNISCLTNNTFYGRSLKIMLIKGA